MFKAIAALSLILASSAAQAYDQNIAVWNTTQVQGKFPDADGKPTSFTWSAEVQPHLRVVPFPSPDQTEHFGNVGMKFDYDLNAQLGAGWLSAVKNDVFVPFSEVRTYVQGGYTPTVGPFSFNLRLRVEERFFPDKLFALRERLYAKAAYNLTDWCALQASNEFFLAESQANTFVPKFDQDRIFVGPKFKVNENFAVEAGYQPILGRTVLDHVFLANLLFSVN